MTHFLGEPADSLSSQQHEQKLILGIAIEKQLGFFHAILKSKLNLLNPLGAGTGHDFVINRHFHFFAVASRKMIFDLSALPLASHQLPMELPGQPPTKKQRLEKTPALFERGRVIFD